MEKSARLVLTSYDSSKIKGAISTIQKSTKTGRVDVKFGKPVDQKVKWTSGQPRIWGCSKADLKRKYVLVSGKTSDLRKISKVQVPKGVYVQLLLKQHA